jgi:hypothetical protein
MDIEQYLSEGQKREIAIEEWRRMCRGACNGNAERIIGNIGHEVATQMVVEALGEDAFDLIREKAVIHDLPSTRCLGTDPDARFQRLAGGGEGQPRAR